MVESTRDTSVRVESIRDSSVRVESTRDTSVRVRVLETPILVYNVE